MQYFYDYLLFVWLFIRFFVILFPLLLFSNIALRTSFFFYLHFSPFAFRPFDWADLVKTIHTLPALSLAANRNSNSKENEDKFQHIWIILGLKLKMVIINIPVHFLFNVIVSTELLFFCLSVCPWYVFVNSANISWSLLPGYYYKFFFYISYIYISFAHT